MTAAGYLNAREAAEYLGVTYRSFDQWVRRHGVPHVRYGRVRKFKRDTLDRVLTAMALRRTA